MSPQVRAKKALGQHFLNDRSIARRIAMTISRDELPEPASTLYGDLPILEVGPGMGVLTQYLQELNRDLKVVEIDTESVEWLHANMPDVDVVEGDFLKMDLAQVFGGRPFALIGNYPYNISSQIFFHMLEQRDLVPVCAGMLQREVAQRICTGPGSKTYGILSVLLQLWYDCEYLFTVPENVFTPPPKVKSGVIRLTRNSRTDAGCDERRLRTVVKTSFGQRRKTLRNSLAGLVAPDRKDVLADPIFNKRPEQLSVEEFIALTNMI